MLETCTFPNPFIDDTVPTRGSTSAGTAVTGAYNGNSFTILVLIVLCPALSMYNAVELLILIFFTFNKYTGVYFWSLLVASVGIIPYSLGFLLKFANITRGNLQWLSIVLLTIGWWTLVTGQSVVLWSRLGLVLEGRKAQRTLQWTKWMIIIDAVILHLPTTVLTFGSNGTIDTEAFAHAYSIMEKIQMSGFFVQEVILSSIYIVSTIKILKSSVRDGTKKLLWQLMGINIIIIVMDMGLLGLEAASQYLLETLLKSVIYSIKLKLEFAILGRLVQFVGRPGASSLLNDERIRRASEARFGPETEERKKMSHDTLPASETFGFAPGLVSDFASLARARTYTTNLSINRQDAKPEVGDGTANQPRNRSDSVRLPPGMTLEEVNLALFQHSEESAIPENHANTETPSSRNDKAPQISPFEGLEKSVFSDTMV